MKNILLFTWVEGRSKNRVPILMFIITVAVPALSLDAPSSPPSAPYLLHT